MWTTDLTLDTVVRLLSENEASARQTLSMVPSETSMSGLAKLPMLLDPYHRYFFNEDDDPTAGTSAAPSASATWRWS